VLPVGIEHFVPVAPVQLTRGWSPLPYAIDRLGRPDWTSVGHDEPLTTGSCPLTDDLLDVDN
jgi:hypothetical protein